MTVEILVLLGGLLFFLVVLEGDCPCDYFRRQVDFGEFSIHKMRVGAGVISLDFSSFC